MTPDDTTTNTTVAGLIAKWRAEHQCVSSFHATMGTGWAVCADELEAALRLSAGAEHERLNGPEICICAAIRMNNGVILRGHRHDDCFNTARKYGYGEILTQGKQGFVTSRNRFVSREEGAQLQQAAGIVSAHTGQFTDFLFSEDLYFNDTAEARQASSAPTPEGPRT